MDRDIRDFKLNEIRLNAENLERGNEVYCVVYIIHKVYSIALDIMNHPPVFQRISTKINAFLLCFFFLLSRSVFKLKPEEQIR